MNIGDLDITYFAVGDTQALKVCLGAETVWESGGTPTPVYSAMPLTFEIISGGTINWFCGVPSYAKTISYSKDDGATWTNITATSGTGQEIFVDAGDKVLFKGDNQFYGNESNYMRGSRFLNSTATFEVYGNIMSLIDSTGFTTADTLYSSCTFQYFFGSATTLISAENLILPATTLQRDCYYGMFQGCTSLTTAPSILPATALVSRCYMRMFEGCTSLTTAPKLPATTTATYCYWGMFQGCTSLTAAPKLPATTLGSVCYAGMFQNCTALTTAPVLPALTLNEYCYDSMFNGCSSLNYIKCLATNINFEECLLSWVNGVAATGTFVKHPNMTSWPSGVDGIPTGWTVQDAVL